MVVIVIWHAIDSSDSAIVRKNVVTTANGWGSAMTY